jgi:hypothetical protein
VDNDFFNAADERQVDIVEKSLEAQRDEELEDLKEILNMPQGMRFFRRLMEYGHIFSSTFTGNSKSYFLEGERNLALRVFNDICEAHPTRVAELMIKRERRN